MKTRRWRVFRGGLRFALSAIIQPVRAGERCPRRPDAPVQQTRKLGAAKRVADICCAMSWRSDQAWSSRRWSAPRFVHGRRRAAFIVRCTAAPGRRARGSRRLAAQPGHARLQHRFAAVNHASDATRGAAGNASEGGRSRGPGAKHGLFDRRRHVAERCPPRETSRVTFPCALSANGVMRDGNTGLLQ